MTVSVPDPGAEAGDWRLEAGTLEAGGGSGDGDGDGSGSGSEDDGTSKRQACFGSTVADIYI